MCRVKSGTVTLAIVESVTIVVLTENQVLPDLLPFPRFEDTQG